MNQWDWELVMSQEDRTLDFLEDIVTEIWKVIGGAGNTAQEVFPQLKTSRGRHRSCLGDPHTEV